MVNYYVSFLLSASIYSLQDFMLMSILQPRLYRLWLLWNKNTHVGLQVLQDTPFNSPQQLCNSDTNCSYYLIFDILH